MSDEIPIGSPPVPSGRHAAPGGWYPDPAREGQERYWDGWQWTRNVRALPGAAPGSIPGYAGATTPRGAHPEGAQPPGTQTSGLQSPGAQPGMSYPNPHLYQIRPLPLTSDGVPLAAYGWRVLAFIIDWALVQIVAGVIGSVTGLSAAITRSMNAYEAYLTEVFTTGSQLDFAYALSILTPPERYIMALVTIACFVIYGSLMLHARGATVGKMACKLRVVPVGEGRSAPGLPWRTAIGRPLFLQFAENLVLLGLINVLFPLWDPKRQALHDKVVKTQVIRER